MALLRGTFPTLLLESLKGLEGAAQELREETRKVRARSTDILAALDEAGLVDVEWDEHGEFLGVCVSREIATVVKGSRGETNEEQEKRPWWKKWVKP